MSERIESWEAPISRQ